MKVLHLLKTSEGATWALRQTRELVRLGVEVHAALPVGGSLVGAYAAAGVRVHHGQFDFPAARPWTFPEVRTRFRALVDAVRPDVIHSHFVGTTLTMRLALGRHHPTPRIFQVPGPLHLEHPFFRRAELTTAGPRDHWIASCAWTRDAYGQYGVGEERRFLSYYGTDLEHFTAAVPAEPGPLRRELSLAATTRIVGMVAYMYAPKRLLGQTRGLKGHEDLIDAVALCRARGHDVICVFVGGPWNGAVHYERTVRRYAERRLGRAAVFLGTRVDVPGLYREFDLVAHPSHSENVGGAVESLLAARPTIATRVGGFPDVIRDGVTGWLVPPRAPAALADAIVVALANPHAAARMARAGQRLVRELFDVRTSARQVARIYGEILAREQRAAPALDAHAHV